MPRVNHISIFCFIFLFFVIAFNTQAKTDKLTTLTSHPPNLPRPVKFPQVIDFLLCLGLHLQLTPINYANYSPPPGGARAPIAPPGYTYAVHITTIQRELKVICSTCWNAEKKHRF